MYSIDNNPKTISPCLKPCPEKFEFVPEWADDFLSLFPHRAAFLWAEHTEPGQRPQWKTEERHLLSDRLIRQGAYLYGVRFGKETNYLMLDIDARSPYHPQHDPFAIGRILEALEPLGLYKHVAVSSSYSDGIHLYFPFLMGQKSWAIAQAVACLLESKGMKPNRGQLELFPNARRMSGADYNGHRLPLQLGSYLLNEDFQPIFTTQDEFVRRWRAVQGHNSVRTEQIDHLLKCYERKASKRLGVSAQKFLNDLNAEIEPGWTGFGQTNTIMGCITRREYIFHHALYGGSPLRGAELEWRIYAVATNLPGYEQYCRHQTHIFYVIYCWARAIEGSNYYPYGGDAVLESESKQSTPTWNQRQAIDARERIRSAVAELLEQGVMPPNVRSRLLALKGYGIGTDALYKNKDLWHPAARRESPEAAIAGVIPPVRGDSAGERSPKAAAAGVIPPICTISLSPCSAPAPPAQGADNTERKAVGGSGGFSTAPEPAPKWVDHPPESDEPATHDQHDPSVPPPPSSAAEGLALLKQVIEGVAQRERQRRQRRTLPLGGVIPDEQYFHQLEVALWRD